MSLKDFGTTFVRSAHPFFLLINNGSLPHEGLTKNFQQEYSNPNPITTMKEILNRIIGVRHRQKMTVGGEVKPTMLCITPAGDPSKTSYIQLETEQEEIDWAHRMLPTKFRDATPEDNPDEFLPWHLQWKKVKPEESIEGLPKNHVRVDGKLTERLHKVPCEFTGLQMGDTVLMLAGGSGNLFGHLLSRVGEKNGSVVMRTSAARAKEFRQASEYDALDQMHIALVWMYASESTKFRQLLPRHLPQVEIEELYKLFADVQNNRKACGLRLYQRAKRLAYLQDGVETSNMVTVQERHKMLLASDPVHQALLSEEKRVELDALEIMEGMPAYYRILEPVKGVGPRIALRILSSLPDITAFETEAQFCAFCGVHALGNNGKKLQKGEIPPTDRGGFPRRKRGVTCDWKPTLRQAMFLLDDQFNRNPKSYWGERRASIKQKLREKHPVPVETQNEAGKTVKRYTDGHIQNMARWKTLNKFCRWLFRELKKLEADISATEGGEVSKAA
jgi:hypothetical protein